MKKFIHDCKYCTYLGSTNIKNGDYKGYYDLYYCCEGNMNIPTVLARFGDDKWEYLSGLHRGLDEMYKPEECPLVKAHQIAKERNFIKG